MEVTVRNADNRLIQYSNAGVLGGAPAGYTNYSLDTATSASLVTALGKPSGGVTLTAVTTANGVSTGTVTALAYVAPATPPPTQVAPGSGAGTGATVTLHQPDPSMSTDVRGIVDVTVGTSPTADGNGHYPLVTVTFGTAWPAAPLGAMIDRVKLSTEDPTQLGLVFSAAMATTGFQIVAQNTPTAGTTYRVSYALG